MPNSSFSLPDLLYDDFDLRHLYEEALSRTLQDPEIRDWFDYVKLKPLHIRLEMLRDAGEIIASVPQEYEDYLAARKAIEIRLDVFLDSLRTAIKEHRLRGPLSAVGYSLTAAGIVLSAISKIARWETSPALGLLAVIAGGAAIFAGRLSTRTVATTFISKFQGFIQPLAYGPWAALAARTALIAALEESELPAQARQRINARRRDRFDHDFRVLSSPGLSEAFDSAYHVPTVVARKLDTLVEGLSGASIGIAGPRGSGKSTLIRRFCEEPPEGVNQGHLRCQVSAPVDYAPRDFVLHLFASFCRRSLRYFATVEKPRFGTRLAFIALTYWLAAWAIVKSSTVLSPILTPLTKVPISLQKQLPKMAMPDLARRALAEIFASPESIARASSLILITVGIMHIGAVKYRHGNFWRNSTPIRLANRARAHLSQIRYLQTFTSGWSGAVKSPIWLEGQASRGRSRAEQPLSYPEIVSTFRTYAQEVATHLRPEHSLYIGIDELDKIGSGDDAERFLNEIKGIFGLSNTYFMISVSDDAMNAFERRGLPFRDSFDSSFDEIIRVGPLDYEESLRLLNRRVLGLPEPYVAFCHCLSGGLSRDLIRAARSVIQEGNKLPDGTASLEPICAMVIREELRNKARAIVESAMKHPMSPELLTMLHHLGHRGVMSPAKEVLEQTLIHALDGPSLEFAVYAYFCATLEEIFTSDLTLDRVGSGDIFDDLAAARYAFALDSQLVWRMISSVRQSWGLVVWEAPG